MLSTILKPSKLFFSLFLLITGVLTLTSGCGVDDELRTWGERSRRKRIEKLNEEEIKKWTEDLKISQERAQELHKNIETLAQESGHQGVLSWKIAKAYVARERFDMASWYYMNSIENRPPTEIQSGENGFEKSLPHFREALLRQRVEHDLLYEAGVAFGNASRIMGWEEERYRTALELFRSATRRFPDDSRSRLQMALLLSKVKPEERRETGEAMELLDEILKREEGHLDARFLRAHILAEQGKLSESLEEYRKIEQLIRDQFGSGLLSGDPEKTPRFKQVKEDMEMLEWCIGGDPRCELR